MPVSVSFIVMLGSSGKTVFGPLIPESGEEQIHRVQGFVLKPDTIKTGLLFSTDHRRTGRGGWAGCSPPKFWATQIFWAAREIWARPVFQEVSMFFSEGIDMFYFNLKLAW